MPGTRIAGAPANSGPKEGRGANQLAGLMSGGDLKPGKRVLRVRLGPKVNALLRQSWPHFLVDTAELKKKGLDQDSCACVAIADLKANGDIIFDGTVFPNISSWAMHVRRKLRDAGCAKDNVVRDRGNAWMDVIYAPGGAGVGRRLSDIRGKAGLVGLAEPLKPRTAAGEPAKKATPVAGAVGATAACKKRKRPAEAQPAASSKRPAAAAASSKAVSKVAKVEKLAPKAATKATENTEELEEVTDAESSGPDTETGGAVAPPAPVDALPNRPAPRVQWQPAVLQRKGKVIGSAWLQWAAGRDMLDLGAFAPAAGTLHAAGTAPVLSEMVVTTTTTTTTATTAATTTTTTTKQQQQEEERGAREQEEEPRKPFVVNLTHYAAESFITERVAEGVQLFLERAEGQDREAASRGLRQLPTLVRLLNGDHRPGGLYRAGFDGSAADALRERSRELWLVLKHRAVAACAQAAAASQAAPPAGKKAGRGGAKGSGAEGKGKVEAAALAAALLAKKEAVAAVAAEATARRDLEAYIAEASSAGAAAAASLRVTNFVQKFQQKRRPVYAECPDLGGRAWLLPRDGDSSGLGGSLGESFSRVRAQDELLQDMVRFQSASPGTQAGAAGTLLWLVLRDAEQDGRLPG
jgi:hypothetical protein